MAGAFIRLTQGGGFVQGAAWVGVFSVVAVGLQVALTVNHKVTDSYVDADAVAYLKTQAGDPIFNGFGVFDNLYDVKAFAAAAAPVAPKKK